MNTQAILKLIDEEIEKLIENDWFERKWCFIWYFQELRDKISSLPSIDIDSLQRYVDEWWMFEDDDGEYVRYDDLVNLIK